MNTTVQGSRKPGNYLIAYESAQDGAEENRNADVNPNTLLGNKRSSALTELANVIGVPAAVRLVRGFGGARVYVPHSPGAGEALVNQIGLSAAAKLSEVYGGERVEVPNPTSRRWQILEMRQQGHSVDTIARTLNCTRRRVFQVLAEARERGYRPEQDGTPGLSVSAAVEGRSMQNE
jgi:hypothetical protein